MAWIKTYTGKHFDFEDLHPRNVCIEDIGHSLASQCRFTGHSKYFYSVAQHSVLVSMLVERGLALDALLHDATEAYVKDLPRPLKQLSIASEYRKLEEKVAFLIALTFNSCYPFEKPIHDADTAMLRAEGMLLMSGVVDWDNLPVTRYDEVALTLLNASGFWTPEKSKRAFLDRYYELTAGTQHAEA